MYLWEWSKRIIQYVFVGISIIWFLAVFIGFIFIFSSDDNDNKDSLVNFVDSSISVFLSLNYKSDIYTDNSLNVTDFQELTKQVAETYSASRNIIRVFSARFIKSIIFIRQTRQIISANSSGDFFTIGVEIFYPPACHGIKLCNDHFMFYVHRTIQIAPREVSFRLTFTNGITSNFALIFQSVNQTIITNTTSTTPIQTISTASSIISNTNFVTSSSTQTTTATTATTATTTTTTTTITTTTTQTTSSITTSTTTTSNPFGCWNMTVLVGYDLYGYDLIQGNQANYSSCCNWCLATAGCVCFSYFPTATYCYLKYARANPTVHTLRISAYF